MHVDKASYGFLTIDHFAPGKDLWLLGAAPDSARSFRYARPRHLVDLRTLIVVHSVRPGDELAYRNEIGGIPRRNLVATPQRLRYVPVARGSAPGHPDGTHSAADRRWSARSCGGRDARPQRSRIMVCGNPDMALATAPQLTGEASMSTGAPRPGSSRSRSYWQGTPS